jgi:carotenoid cleavage dioxygenase-like enzyme
VFVELDTRRNDGFTVSLEWNRDTGQTQIVINDARTARQTVFQVPCVSAADAFRHPFRYAP